MHSRSPATERWKTARAGSDSYRSAEQPICIDCLSCGGPQQERRIGCHGPGGAGGSLGGRRRRRTRVHNRWMLCFCRDGNRALQRGLTTDADGLVPGTLNFAWTLGVIVARWSRGRRFASSTSSTDDIDARSSASRQVLALVEVRDDRLRVCRAARSVGSIV